MDREAEAHLIAFCVAQRGGFDPAAWDRFSAVTPLELAATARFLAGVSWYGHEKPLEAIARRLSPGSFAELARATKFDAPRFAGLLQAHLRHAQCRPAA